MPESEAAWRRHVHNIGFIVEEANSIVDGAISVLQWSEAGATAHALELLRLTHTGSWFTVDGINTVCSFTAGALAGTSLADIVFILCMARVVSKIQDELQAAGLVTHVPTSDTFDALGIYGDSKAPIGSGEASCVG